MRKFAVALLLLTACTSRRPAAHLSSSPSATPASAATSTADFHEPTTFSLSDVYFIDQSNGWALGAICAVDCDGRIFRTTDGGRTWKLIGLDQTGSAPYGSIVFVDKLDGWMFDTHDGVQVTHDGGHHWELTALANEDASITSLVPVGRSVWVLSHPYCETEPTCTFHLSISSDGGGAWRQARGVPDLKGYGAELVRTDATHAYISTWSAGGSEPDLLFSTSDGGRTWTRRKNPCSISYDHSIAAFGSSSVWLMCGSEPGAGQQLKELFRSSDGGVHWIKEASPPGSGYVGQILATTSSSIWFSLHRNGPLHSNDGGHSWTNTGIVTRDDFSGFGAFHFLDPTHGWITNYAGIFRTTNGGRSWSHVVLKASF